MPETADNAEPGVITPSPSEPAPEQAQTPEEPDAFTSDVPANHPAGASDVVTPSEPGAASDQEDDTWDFADQAEGFDESAAAFNGFDELDGTDWAEDDGLDWLLEEDQPAPEFNSMEDFDAYISDQVGEVVQDYAYQQEMQGRAESLAKLEQQYPDITDYVDQIRPALEARAQQHGLDPQLVLTDPALVLAVYQGLKAEATSDPATEQAEALAAGISEMAQASEASGGPDAFSG